MSLASDPQLIVTVEPLLVTIAQAAELLQSSDKTVHRLIDAGELPVVLLGERWERIPVAALRQFVERRTQGQRPAAQPVVLKPVRPYIRRASR